MATVQLDLDTLATLHGLQDSKPRQLRNDGPRLPEDANEIAAKVLYDPGLADRLYKDVPGNEQEFRDKPLNPSAYGLFLSLPVVPEADKAKWPKERVKRKSTYPACRGWGQARALVVYVARAWERMSTKELGHHLQRVPSMISRLYAAYAAERGLQGEAQVAQVLREKVKTHA